MFKKTKITSTEVVLVVGKKTVAWTLSVTGKEPGTPTALGRKSIAFLKPKVPLAFTVHKFGYRVLSDVTKTVLGKNEMIAAIYITVSFDDSNLTA